MSSKISTTIITKKNLSCSVVEYSAAEWSHIVGYHLAQVGIPPDAVAFEYDPKKFVSEVNPGVGPALGTVKDPEVITYTKQGRREIRTEVLFADDTLSENILQGELLITECGVGESFDKDGKRYTLQRLLDRGVEVLVSDLSKKTTKRKAVKTTTRRSRKKTTPAFNCSACKKTTPRAECHTVQIGDTPASRMLCTACFETATKTTKTTNPPKTQSESQSDESHESQSDESQPDGLWLNDESQSDESPEAQPDGLWLKCTAPRLNAVQRHRLVTLMLETSNRKHDLFYPFITRIAKVYAQLHRRADEPIHLAREQLVSRSIRVVRRQVRPLGLRKDIEIEHVLPTLETVFEMPGPGLTPGSKAWIESLAERPTLIPYSIAVLYTALEKVSVRQVPLVFIACTVDLYPQYRLIHIVCTVAFYSLYRRFISIGTVDSHCFYRYFL